MGASSLAPIGSLGAHTFTVTATSASGQNASVTSTYSVVAAPAVTPVPPVVAAPVPPPTVSSVRQSHVVWRLGSQLATLSRAHRPPVGTRFDFTLNERATVALVFTQRVAGRRITGRCITKSRRRHAPRCAVTVIRAVLRGTGRPGANHVSFQGSVSRSRRLKPGTYMATITATNSAGRHSRPRSLRFTIVR